MNKDKIVETIGDMDPEFVKEARPKSRSRLALRIGAVAAAVLMLVGVCFAIPKFLNNPGMQEPQKPSVSNDPTMRPVQLKEGWLAAAPGELTFVSYTDPVSEAWVKALGERKAAGGDIAPMDGFMRDLTLELMKEGGNVVWSPSSVYLSLAMLAESADGSTREEILSALGAADMASLRKSAAAILAAENYDDGKVKSLFANSLWFNKDKLVSADTVDRLAELYRASTYWGDPNDPGYEEAMRDWLKENTGGLLDDSADKLEMDPRMLLEICSAVCFKGGWGVGFDARYTREKTFRGAHGDKTAEFMYKQNPSGKHFAGAGFKAAVDSIGESGNSIIYLLPDEGVSIEEMLRNVDVGGILANAEEGGVNLSVPKFDISCDSDLIPALKGIGLSECFDDNGANFTQLTDDAGVYVTKVDHSARVMIDEEGIAAAAFTRIEMGYNGGMEMTLDRPFVFIVTGVSGAPLFIGLVNDIG